MGWNSTPRQNHSRKEIIMLSENGKLELMELAVKASGFGKDPISFYREMLAEIEKPSKEEEKP